MTEATFTFVAIDDTDHPRPIGQKEALMLPSTWQEWFAWAGVVVPLAALAWAAFSYSRTYKREADFQQFERVFRVMDHLGQQDGSIASKMAAAYELRGYPTYKDVIIRLCEKVQIEGSAAMMLQEELLLTAKHLKDNK